MQPDSSEVDSRWLAYELHDGLLQWVISARMQVESGLLNLRKLHQVEEQGDLRALLDHSQAQLTAAHSALLAAIDEGRQLIGFLEDAAQKQAVDVPSLLARIGNELATELDANNQTLAIRGFEEPEWQTLQPRTGWNLMRIIQQAVRNAMRHAGPCDISLEGSRLPQGGWQIRMEDSGKGFDASVARSPDQFGLASLKHRAGLLGGKLEVASQIGQGTVLKLQVPAFGA